jgi:leucyl aminopeptidase
MQIEFIEPPKLKSVTGALAVMAFEGGLSAGAGEVDKAAGGAVSRAISAGRFKGKCGQSLEINAPPDLKAQRIVAVGLGPEKELKARDHEVGAAHAYSAVKTSGSEALTIYPAGGAAICAHVALGVSLAAYRFDRYRTKEEADKKPSVKTVRIVAEDPKAAKKAWAPLSALADGICFTRDLVSEPANVLSPEEFAGRVKALESMGLTVEILGEKEMAKLGMGALLGVGQGSRRESKLAVITWKGGPAKTPPVAFVGKGVCFDSGGLSLKLPQPMEDMKWDMGGAAAVAGLMHVLAGRKARVNAVGVLGLVENMPDGNAQRPGDVVTSMSGQTIEVLNTDAEGRLVLADALWYCQDRFKPKAMVDLATLTGAIISALGHDYAGLFSNNEDLCKALQAASEESGDQLWRMPMPKPYEKQLESMIADMRNIGGPPAGSITAGLFLQRFVNDTPWAHLDIAGTAWKRPSNTPTIPEGATGFGVRLLNQLVADTYET